jgi:hypothetical protein
MIRTLSFSEVSTALRCQARHAFSYTGHLSGGDTLKPVTTPPILRDGRAWGAGVAALHETGERAAGLLALSRALNEDADEQREAGIYDEELHREALKRLAAILDHYAATAELFEIEASEVELNVPLPARSGDPESRSSRYRLQCFLDGVLVDRADRVWIVENKLRGSLTSAEQITLSRQLRYYAWAYWRETGILPAGAITVERLNQAPKLPRMVKGRGKNADPVPSHAKDQLTTAEAYVAVCGEHGVEPKPETVEALGQRRWQQKVPVVFRQGELDETARELAAAAHLIGELDAGRDYPLRNANPMNCGGCQFRDICPTPDPDLIDALFRRGTPKRLDADRNRKEATA